MPTTTEKLTEKFRTPQTFRFQGERTDDEFFYTVDAELFMDMRVAYDAEDTPLYLYEPFHPKNSIDDFLFWLQLSALEEFSKRYNLDVFGCVSIEYCVKDGPSGAPSTGFYITVRYPDQFMSNFHIRNMLKYLVFANYRALARRLSAYYYNPPIRYVFLILQSDSHEIVDHNGTYLDCFNAKHLAECPHGDYIFIDFEPCDIDGNVFAACQILPFPLIDLTNPATIDADPATFFATANEDDMQMDTESLNVIPP